MIAVVASVAVVGGSNRRTLGAHSPERGAAAMVLAAYDSDPYEAVRVLDPKELQKAAQLFTGVGDKLSWLATLKGVLGGSDTPTGVDTTAAARSDGSIGVKIVGLRYGRKPTQSDTSVGSSGTGSLLGEVVQRLGIRQRPTLIMVQRNGRWFVSGSASVREAAASALGVIG